MLLLGMTADVEIEADGYRLCERLSAKGGMSEVFLGVKLSTGALVVLKSIPAHWDVPELAARLAREAESLERLQHEHIVPFIEFRSIAGCPRLVTPLVEGVSLREWMHGNPRLEKKLALMGQIARAIGYAHTQGIAHRDLKPDNIVVGQHDMPVVLDFGLAALLDAAGESMAGLTRAGLTAGTPQYMAPEQASGRCLYPAAADVYALGVMLFELLTGEQPLPRRSGETDALYLQRLLSEKPRRFPVNGRGLSRARDLEAVCSWAMARDPRDRPSAEQMAEELTRVLRHEPVLARVPGIWARTHLELKRRPGVWATVLLLITGLTLVASWIQGTAIRERSARSMAEAALTEARQVSAASDVVAAQEALARGGPDLAMPWVAKALRSHSENKSARFMAAQLLGDRRILSKISEIQYMDGGELALPAAFQPVKHGIFLVDLATRQLFRCQIQEEAAELRLAPWPATGDPSAQCAEVAFDGRGSRIAIVKTDGSLSFHEVESGNRIWHQPCVWPDRRTREHHVHVSASGEWVVHCAILIEPHGSSTLLKVISADTGTVMLDDVSLPHHVPAQSLAVTYQNRLLVAAAAHSTWIGCINLGTGETRDLSRIWSGDSNRAGSVFAVQPLPDSDRVLLAGQHSGYRVICVDAREDSLIWEQKGFGTDKSHVLAIGAIRPDPEFHGYAATSSEGEVLIGNLLDGGMAGLALPTGFKPQLLHFDDQANLVCSGVYSSIWNVKTGEQLAVAAAPMLVPCGDRHYISNSGGTLALWKLEEGAQSVVDIHPGAGATSFELDESGRHLLVAGFGGTAQVWDLAAMAPKGPAVRHVIEIAKARMPPVKRPRLAARSERFVTWESEHELAVYTVLHDQPGLLLKTRHEKPVECCAISPDGRWLVVALADGSWEAWSVDEGERHHHSTALCRAPPDDGALDSPGVATSMAFSADGSLLAIGTKLWCTLSIWKVGDWRPVQPPLMGAHAVTDLKFHRHVLWSSDFLGQCRRLDRPPYHKLDRVPHLGLAVPAFACDISSRGNWVAMAMSDGTARIHAASSLNPLPGRLEHAGEVTAVDWSGDERMLLTGSAAGEVYLWDRTTGRRVFSWPQGDVRVLQAALARNDELVVIARSDGRVRIRKIYYRTESAADLAERLEFAAGFKLSIDGQLVPK